MRKVLLFIFILGATLQMQAQSMQELQTLYVQEQYEDLLALLDAPSSADQHLLWADAHHKLGHFEEAMKGYLQAESAGENSFDLFLNRGICAFSLGDFQLTRSDLLKAKTLREDQRIPYYFAAMAYMENNHKAAAVFIKDALQLDANYMEAHYLLGAIYLEQKKFSGAEKAFISCIELRPEFTQSKINLALCFIEQFKFDEAIGLLSSLIENLNDATLADAYYQRGVCHYQMHNTTLACEDWHQASELGDSFAKEHIAGICEGNQRKIKRKKDIYMAF